MLVEMQWPIGGVSDLRAVDRQATGKGQAPTCVDARNVRTRDSTTGRWRGAQRGGHSRYINSTVSGANPVQRLGHVVGTTGASRTMYPFAVSAGNILGVTAGPAYTGATGGSGALSSTFAYIGSAVHNGVVYFADGANYKKWTAATNTASNWTASAGTIPANGSNKPRLICEYRGRILLSGVSGDDQNIFGSKVGDPTDWDYAGGLATSAWALNADNGPGVMSDAVTALIPFSDDLLLIGGDHTLNIMSNDPSDGGRIDLISSDTGIAYGHAWCKDPSGVVYFFGSRGGLWKMSVDAAPEQVSMAIDKRLQDVDLSANKVVMAWDDREKVVMIYITNLAGGASVHYCYEPLTGAFWPDNFATAGHNPMCVHVLDGDAVGDRVLLLGCLDGYTRKTNPTGKDDDDAAISSYVWMGPWKSLGKGLILRGIQIHLATTSDPITGGVYKGYSGQDAFASAAFYTHAWTAARKHAERKKALGNVIYYRISDATLTKAWQFESGVVEIEETSAEAFNRLGG